MASYHTLMNYFRAYSKNRCVYNLLALSLSARTCWQWARPKRHSLLSAHRLICACFLTTESDKRMRLLTVISANSDRAPPAPKCIQVVWYSMLVREETSPEFVRLLLIELTWGRWSIRTGSMKHRCNVLAGETLQPPYCTVWHYPSVTSY